MSNEKCVMCKQDSVHDSDCLGHEGVNLCFNCKEHRASITNIMLCELQAEVKRLSEKVDVLLGEPRECQ